MTERVIRKRIFIEYNKHTGEIIGTTFVAEGFGINSDIIRDRYPERDILILPEGSFEGVDMANQAYYRINNGAVVKRAEGEIAVIRARRDKWKERNTILGLSNQVEGLKKEVEKLKNAKIQEEVK